MEKLVFQSVFFPEAAVKLRIPVFRISRKRMTDAREMAADLMALSGHQLNLQQRTASSLVVAESICSTFHVSFLNK